MSKINKLVLKKLMLEKKLTTYTELANALGISKTQLSNLLSDKFNPIKSNIQEMADFFGIDPIKILEK